MAGHVGERMKQFIGTYSMCAQRVRVYSMKGTGAHAEFLPKDKGVTIMEIGLDHKHWSDVLGSLLHEAQESAMYLLGHSYQHYGYMSNGTADFVFMLTHEQFNECCLRAADLIAECQTDLHSAWKKWKAPKKIRNKKRNKIRRK